MFRRSGCLGPIIGDKKKSYTARYSQKENLEKRTTNELEEYFKLPAEDFEVCNPIQWWVDRRHQFPHLFQLARDILCIPGKGLLGNIVIHTTKI